MEESKFMDKLENTGELSKVEKDIYNLQSESNKTLINYLIAHVETEELLNNLDSALDQALLDKVQDLEEPMSTSAIIAAMKVIKDFKIQKSNGILGF